jgi:hypothetical protein
MLRLNFETLNIKLQQSLSNVTHTEIKHITLIFSYVNKGQNEGLSDCVVKYNNNNHITAYVKINASIRMCAICGETLLRSCSIPRP